MSNAIRTVCAVAFVLALAGCAAPVSITQPPASSVHISGQVLANGTPSTAMSPVWTGQTATITIGGTGAYMSPGYEPSLLADIPAGTATPVYGFSAGHALIRLPIPVNGTTVGWVSTAGIELAEPGHYLYLDLNTGTLHVIDNATELETAAIPLSDAIKVPVGESYIQDTGNGSITLGAFTANEGLPLTILAGARSGPGPRVEISTLDMEYLNSILTTGTIIKTDAPQNPFTAEIKWKDVMTV